MKRIISIMLAAGSFLCSAQFASGQSFSIGEEDKLSLYLAWTNQFQFAGYYAAKEMGYYKEAGIDLTLVSGKQTDQVDAVLSNEYTYAVGTGGLILADDRAGELTVLAAFMQQSPVTLLTVKSNNINTLEDLEGKDVVGGVEIKLMLASADVDLNKVNFHGLATDHENLINGTYDGISYYITDHSKVLGSDTLLFNTFRPIEYGINFYGECLFTSRKEVEDNPERTKRMVDATIKGWEYAITHQEEIVDIIISKYGTDLTREELLEEAEITIHSLIQPNFYDVGDMQYSKWKQMADLMVSLNVLDKSPDLKDFIYDPPAGRDDNLRQLLKIFWILLSIGAAILFLLLLYNTQLKKAVATRTRSLERTNLELDRFVYSVSHDIRSPLSSIEGIINLMKLDPDGKDKYLELIDSSVKQLNDFTSEILDYSRNSRMELAKEPVNINSLIEKSIEDLKYLDNNQRIRFIKKFEHNGSMFSDEWRLKIILGNLISNSIKYSDPEKESPFVKIKTEVVGNELRIEFSDNGIGIEPQHLNKIFDMFYRATEESKGSGLGLYIVNETIKVMKGKINIESVPKEGTNIILKIPISSNGKN